MVRDYQMSNAQRLKELIEEGNCACDMSDMGVGKTWTALQVATLMQRDVLVICPKGIIPCWEAIAQEFQFKYKLEVVNYEKVRINKDHHFGHTVGRWFRWGIAPDRLVIFDEAHRLKGINTKIARQVSTLPNRCLLLSATLATSPLELRCIGKLLGLHNWRDFYTWIQFNGCERNIRFGGFLYSDTTNTRWLEALRERSVCTKIKDVSDQLPKNKIMTRVIPVKKTRLIRSAFDKYVELKDKKDDATSFVAALGYAIQMCELQKMGYFAERIVDAVAQGYQVITYVVYKESQAALASELLYKRIKKASINGDSPQSHRNASIRDFMSGKVKCIISTFGTGSEGISLDDRQGDAKRLVLLSPIWSAVKLKQALGRAFRITTKSNVIQEIVFAKDTLEEKVAENVEAKLEIIDRLTDQDLFMLPPVASACVGKS